ncbi:hypothetical protein ASF99_10760 [Exiguobacterium sp. Leaf187]|uniref:hypothetical protein n=1 Tax=Exiguobacterium TaxID=33986 RepID=UPI0003C3C9DB|nr:MULTISPECIES: hypothetical protein [Exiguobacterium]AHA31067.1 hypothetical protein U719_15950 [Exiguobacterium sp. MH3]KQS16865.1 hypothetical protein ASF99_10760 [Exiguobacterium sp. Leaf187]MCQ4091663.1 hypothetical protein [Exiguobacterium sp. LL15]NTY10969.1 hypothetical protein [Exiguobacterium sp. JMULE1]
MKPKPFAKWLVGLSSSVFIGLAIGQLSVSSNDSSTTPVSTGDTYSNDTTLPSQGNQYSDDEGEYEGDDGYYEDDDDDQWQGDESSGFSQPGGSSDGQSSHSR